MPVTKPKKTPTPAPLDNSDAGKAARLEAVFSRLSTPGNNPFAAVFAEYAARLETGKQASLQFENPETRARHEAAMQRAAPLLTLAAGLPRGATPDSDAAEAMLAFQVMARAAETAKWYDELRAKARVLNCPPELAEYVAEGIPPVIARRFFNIQCPPKNAGHIYGMIYAAQRAAKVAENFKAVADIVAATGPVPSSSPTRLRPLLPKARSKTGRSGRGGRKRI